MNRLKFFAILCCFVCIPLEAQENRAWPGFKISEFKNEQVREIRFAGDARAILIAPRASEFDAAKSTQLVIYATPNGNTAEQTLGCQLAEGMDWHFDIQHVAAQWRVFRSLETNRNVVLACVQAENLSWPAWKSQRPHGPQYIRQLVEALAASIPSEKVRVVLTGHSGGGSFIFGYIDAVDEIPPSIERIAFLDANYGYANELKHGEKIVRWLTRTPDAHFLVLAYDDRNIELDGKKVVSPTGGTYRATNRMLDFLKEQMAVKESQRGDFSHYLAFDGRLMALVHPNPDNIILHTRLVGEMNGLLAALSIGTAEKWAIPTPPRAYTQQVQPEPFMADDWRPVAPALPTRRANSPGGNELIESLLDSQPLERELRIAGEILSGNVPTFWRKFENVEAEWETEDGAKHKTVYRVSPDYLMMGSDDDFVRVPITPHTAQLIADTAGCVLPTRKMVDDIHRAAKVTLEPHPLTEDRESLATFLKHHQLIQEQLQKHQPHHLISGIKKDVVVTNKLLERPDRVAIYGWHKLDGQPIQPLTTVHVDWYVDYSHGIRLVDQWCDVDGESMRVGDVLRDPELSGLLSDEGVIEHPVYRRKVK